MRSSPHKMHTAATHPNPLPFPNTGQVKSFAAEGKEAARYSQRLEATRELSAGAWACIYTYVCVYIIITILFDFTQSSTPHPTYQPPLRGRAEARADGVLLPPGHLLFHLHRLRARRATRAVRPNDRGRPCLVHRVLLQVRV